MAVEIYILWKLQCIHEYTNIHARTTKLGGAATWGNKTKKTDAMFFRADTGIKIQIEGKDV